MKIKDNELREVLSAIESDLNKAFDLSKDSLLAKAAPEDEKEAPPEGSESAAGDASASAPAESPAPELPPGDASASASPAPEMSDSAPQAPQDPAADAAPLTPEALQAEYSQLAPEELDMHIKAALAAKEALAASAAPAPDQSAPPMPPESAPAMPPAAPPAMKAEIKPEGNGGEMKPVKKSEPEVDPRDEKLQALEAVIKSQNEDIAALTKAVTMVLERPERKAVTSVAFLGKSEPEAKPVSASEARAKLNSLIPSLSKSERDLVLDFYAGRVGVDKLATILDKAK